MAIKVRRGHLYPQIKLEEGLEIGLDETEWDKIVDRLGRNPNHFEAKIFAALWSEDVSNKSSSELLKTIKLEYDNVKTATGSPLGLIELSNGQYLALRTVNNNKQTEIDSFYGAQTAIDCAIEELASVGAKPLALLNLFRFGSHDLIKNKKLFQGATHGSSLFTNRIGIPFVGGNLYFHKNYNAAPMVNSSVVGILDSENALKPTDVPIGSSVLYVGAKTGRDGLVNASGNAKLLKMGDALLSNKVTNACSEAIEKGCLKELVAVDRGGLAVACFDISQRIQKPILFDIDRIPLREDIKEPIDIILSESSERVLMITNRENHRELNKVLNKWDLESVKIGEVNDADGIEFYWNHYLVADIPFQFALDGSTKKTFDVVKFPPMLKRSAGLDDSNKARKNKRKVVDEWSLVREVSSTTKDLDEHKELDCPKNLEDIWLDLLANPNLCSRAPVFEMYDQVVGANTIQKPGGDAAIMRLKSTSDIKSALAITQTSNSLYVMMEPYLGTVQTVAEGMRNLASVGARPKALATCLNFGLPDNYKDICDLSEAIRGLGDASKIWDIPIIQKEVSLFNGRKGSPCMPTPGVLMAGELAQADKYCSVEFKNKGDIVFLIGLTKNEIYCTEYSNYFHKYVNKLVPDIDFKKEKNVSEFIVSLIEQDLLNSCHDVSSGGVAIALSESCLNRATRPIGVRLEIEKQEFDTPAGKIPLRQDAALFSESSARFLISCKAENEEQILRKCADNNIEVTGFGVVGGSSIKITGAANVELPLSTTYKLWSYRLQYLLGYREKEELLAG